MVYATTGPIWVEFQADVPLGKNARTMPSAPPTYNSPLSELDGGDENEPNGPTDQIREPVGEMRSMNPVLVASMISFELRTTGETPLRSPEK